MAIASVTAILFVASLDGAGKTLFQLRRSEHAYNDIAMRIDFVYETNDDFIVPDGVLSWHSERLWQVASLDEYRLELTGRSPSAQGERQLSALVESHSNGTTRISSATTGKVAKKYRGRGRHFVYPHSIVLRLGSGNLPLSEYIAGKHHLGQARVSHLGTHTVSGLQCHQLRVEEQSETGEIEIVREFFLAEDRNYFPVRVVTYSIRDSNKIPSRIASIDKFVEMSPGRWFPARGSCTGFDKTRIRNNQEQVWRWKTSFDLRGVDLSSNILPDMLKLAP